jgi:hypothetical protein
VISAGETTAIHTHMWSDPIPPHSLENVGDAELCVIMVELKDAAPVETA